MNGARSRGPKTPEGQGALGTERAQARHARPEHMVLPDEDAVASAALQTARFVMLAPEGALQIVLARRAAIAAGASPGPAA